ncbi:MAG: hypothetical protein KC731_12215 [Myxococcales bacterium]|nr:hypothetical protein [Myxococcales bacterium]
MIRSKAGVTWDENDSDEELTQLCRVALAALHEEERRLNLAFTSSAEHLEYAHINRGLAYWLYETTLVYVVFRAWIPLVHVTWDYDRGAKRGPIDLTVRKNGELVRAFEAKHWMHNGNGPLDRLEQDRQKLSASGAPKQYLMTFWHTADVKKDLVSADVACQRQDWHRSFVGWFPCDHVDDEARNYVLCVIDTSRAGERS